MAWHPRKQGLLATGCVSPDNKIRVWDIDPLMNVTDEAQYENMASPLKHVMGCLQGVTSLSWHDFSNKSNGFQSELLSSHASLDNLNEIDENKLALW